MSQFSVVILGSFRKHFKGITETVEAFESLGVKVLSPRATTILDPGVEFVILETDDSDDPRTLEDRVLAYIDAADAVYLYNADGYIGVSAAMELGYCIAAGKLVFVAETPRDPLLSTYADKVATPRQVLAELVHRQHHHFPEKINERSNLPALQRYVREMVLRRGFADETPIEIMLLMTGEVGELARAVRKVVGLKVDADRASRLSSLQDEMADVLLYLLDLANALEVSLGSAVLEKERANEQRHWTRSARAGA